MYGPYRLGHQEGDGLLLVPAGGSRIRVNRGGSFSNIAVHARSSNRSYSSPEYRVDIIGCRPAVGITAE